MLISVNKKFTMTYTFHTIIHCVQIFLEVLILKILESSSKYFPVVSGHKHQLGVLKNIKNSQIYLQKIGVQMLGIPTHGLCTLITCHNEGNLPMQLIIKGKQNISIEWMKTNI